MTDREPGAPTTRKSAAGRPGRQARPLHQVFPVRPSAPLPSTLRQLGSPDAPPPPHRGGASAAESGLVSGRWAPQLRGGRLVASLRVRRSASHVPEVGGVAPGRGVAPGSGLSARGYAAATAATARPELITSGVARPASRLAAAPEPRRRRGARHGRGGLLPGTVRAAGALREGKPGQLRLLRRGQQAGPGQPAPFSPRDRRALPAAPDARRVFRAPGPGARDEAWGRRASPV